MKLKFDFPNFCERDQLILRKYYGYNIVWLKIKLNLSN